MAEKYYSISPYVYCEDDPVGRVDYNGADWYRNNETGEQLWREGHNNLIGYTNIGSSTVIRVGEDKYQICYQNGSFYANKPVDAYDLISSEIGLQRLFLGSNSPLSDASKSELFNALWGSESNEIGYQIDVALFDLANTIYSPASAFKFAGRVTSTLKSLISKAITSKAPTAIERVCFKGGESSFKSFQAFKRCFGPAGEGYSYHHIVEQNATNLAQFGAEKIHNTENIVRLPNYIHRKISARYSSKMKDGIVRKVVSKMSYKEQYDYGMKTLNEILKEYNCYIK
jgi:hypothetical protein